MHILELIIGLAALAFLGQLGYADFRERKRRQALDAYQERLVGAVTDSLLLRALESQELPSEADISWELEKQFLDNQHWQSTLGVRFKEEINIPLDRLLQRFYAKVMASKVPEYLRRQAYQKLHQPHH